MIQSARHTRLKITLWMALIALVLASLLTGALDISLSDGMHLIAQKLGFSPSEVSLEEQALKQTVFFELRLARVALAILTGATLAVCGAVMQGLFRNPLADPGLMGISSGCALGAAVFAVFGFSPLVQTGTLASIWALPSAAFLGGLFATGLVFYLGKIGGRTDVATLLLAGIAINLIASAGVSGLQFIADDQSLRGIVYWLLGDLSANTWDQFMWIAPLQITCLIILIFYAPVLNALLLGEAEAGHLGFNIEKTKLILIALIALAVGLSVSIAGVIGFVGLIVPHMLRRLIGADHRYLLPMSALLGAVLLLCADLLSRTLAAPTQIPVGILMALIGGPFFIWILFTSRFQFSK